jgi:opacity protein-like surface antigen
MKLNKLIKPLLVSCLVPLSLVAQADDAMNFITLNVGADQAVVYNNKANIDTAETGLLGGVEIGRKLNDMFALGVEYQYHAKTKFNMKSNTDTYGTSLAWAVRSNVVLATMRMTLTNDAKVMPFIKLGLGASRNKADDYKTTDVALGTSTYPGKTKTNFAWQLGAGLSVPMSDMFDAEMAYSFIDRGEIRTQGMLNNQISNNPSDAKVAKLRDHAITLGLKFKF